MFNNTISWKYLFPNRIKRWTKEKEKQKAHKASGSNKMFSLKKKKAQHDWHHSSNLCGKEDLGLAQPAEGNEGESMSAEQLCGEQQFQGMMGKVRPGGAQQRRSAAFWKLPVEGTILRCVAFV